MLKKTGFLGPIADITAYIKFQMTNLYLIFGNQTRAIQGWFRFRLMIGLEHVSTNGTLRCKRFYQSLNNSFDKVAELFDVHV